MSAAVATPPNKITHVTVHLRPPHPKQELFLRSKAKRKIIRAGRRGGKTTGIAILAVEEFLKGRRILYATPTSDQIVAFWREVKKALAECLDAGVYYKNETEHIIEVPGKLQRIRAKTAWNADTLRGDYADLLILDEFQLMNEDTWATVGAPMLLDNNGDAVFIYTPPSLHSAGVTKAEDVRHASKMYKKAQADASGRWAAFHFTSHDNPHISEAALQEIAADMTRLAYMQEIEAQDIDEVPGALWTRKLIEETRVAELPCGLTRIVVGVDPSGSTTTEAGIVAGGIGEDNHLYFVKDNSLLAPTPRAWASAAVSLYEELQADRICGERNYGGDMVKETITTVSENVSYKDVVASRGKLIRAEPIAALFEKAVAHIVGKMEKLEDEMCSYVPGAKSPNRLDAAVWVGIELVVGGSLGLIEFFKQGQAQKQYDALVAPVDVAKAVIAAGEGKTTKLTKCPACECVTVKELASKERRCMECGTQFGLEGALPKLQTRRDYLVEASR